MDQAVFIILLSEIIIFLILIAINASLFFYFKKTQKKFDVLLENGNVLDLKDILIDCLAKTKNQEQLAAEILKRTENLENASKKDLSKVGIVRFNPFANSGGNQSFAIALLDRQNNGFVISCLFVDQASRVYVKTVVSGKSEYNLSDEEKEAIARANGSENSKS